VKVKLLSLGNSERNPQNKTKKQKKCFEEIRIISNWRLK
jgi:hypothetical protein